MLCKRQKWVSLVACSCLDCITSDIVSDCLAAWFEMKASEGNVLRLKIVARVINNRRWKNIFKRSTGVLDIDWKCFRFSSCLKGNSTFCGPVSDNLFSSFMEVSRKWFLFVSRNEVRVHWDFNGMFSVFTSTETSFMFSNWLFGWRRMICC